MDDIHLWSAAGNFAAERQRRVCLAAGNERGTDVVTCRQRAGSKQEGQAHAGTALQPCLTTLDSPLIRTGSPHSRSWPCPPGGVATMQQLAAAAPFRGMRSVNCYIVASQGAQAVQGRCARHVFRQS